MHKNPLERYAKRIEDIAARFDARLLRPKRGTPDTLCAEGVHMMQDISWKFTASTLPVIAPTLVRDGHADLVNALHALTDMARMAVQEHAKGILEHRSWGQQMSRTELHKMNRLVRDELKRCASDIRALGKSKLSADPSRPVQAPGRRVLLSEYPDPKVRNSLAKHMARNEELFDAKRVRRGKRIRWECDPDLVWEHLGVPFDGA
jgi:hypothetical protein